MIYHASAINPPVRYVFNGWAFLKIFDQQRRVLNAFIPESRRSLTIRTAQQASSNNENVHAVNKNSNMHCKINLKGCQNKNLRWKYKILGEIKQYEGQEVL